jgi:hypothetical protein
MDGLLGTLPLQIEGIAGRILDYAILLAAVGTVTMALVELLKGLFFLRRLFHRYMLDRWLAAAPDPVRAGAELTILAAGGQDNSGILCDQPTARMMGQVQAAANVALDFPDRYPALFGFLASAPSAHVKAAASDAETWQAFSVRHLAARARKTAGEETATRAAAQARARLGNLVTRKLDALQTAIEYWWARLNQLAAVSGGTLLLAYLLSKQAALTGAQVFVLALIGGLMAPFAKDVVSALTGLRVRRA